MEEEDDKNNKKNNSYDYNEDNDDDEEDNNDSDENSNEKLDDRSREEKLFELFENNKEQVDRYEKYKSSTIEHDKKKKTLQKLECPRTKRIVQSVLGDNVQMSSLVQIILSGVTKIYAGELVEEAKRILVEEEDSKEDKKLGKKRYSQILPRHLREARRRMIKRGVLPLILNNNYQGKKKIV